MMIYFQSSRGHPVHGHAFSIQTSTILDNLGPFSMGWRSLVVLQLTLQGKESLGHGGLGWATHRWWLTGDVVFSQRSPLRWLLSCVMNFSFVQKMWRTFQNKKTVANLLKLQAQFWSSETSRCDVFFHPRHAKVWNLTSSPQMAPWTKSHLLKTAAQRRSVAPMLRSTVRTSRLGPFSPVKAMPICLPWSLVAEFQVVYHSKVQCLISLYVCDRGWNMFKPTTKQT